MKFIKYLFKKSWGWWNGENHIDTLHLVLFLLSLILVCFIFILFGKIKLQEDKIKTLNKQKEILKTKLFNRRVFNNLVNEAKFN